MGFVFLNYGFAYDCAMTKIKLNVENVIRIDCYRDY